MNFLSLLVFTILTCRCVAQNSSSSSWCPLDLSVLEPYISAAKSNPSWIPTSVPSLCTYALQYLHLAEAQYLRTSSLFLPNSSSSSSSDCLSSLSSLLSPILPSSLPTDCGFSNQSLSLGCMNITSVTHFDSLVPASARADISLACNSSLGPSVYSSECTACTASLTKAAAYLPGPDLSNLTRCKDYPFIYAAAVSNLPGPADPSTASCLFLLQSQSPARHRLFHPWPYALSASLLALAVLAISLFLYYRKRRRIRKTVLANTPSPALDSIGASTGVVRFRFEELRAATRGFSRDGIVGLGGYGNVYRGTLPDGTAVALKRFKNCSAAGDAGFAHEVEVIASVRHVNLVALRGYCTATTAMEGHQRIIVCDLMANGSLHDHLFGDGTHRRLSWPVRQRIALGTARGLAYLHYGAQPAIIHRDIKASNILLDDRFEPKVADFGLARFAPEGMSHVSTRVAGTLGYVAPEYALYGQLTEKSDVYSFGVVMLELLSGKKAFLSPESGQNLLITDWAWSLVRTGNVLDVLEDGMEEVGPREVMEKYVLLAVLASHPQLHARPTMDQVLKILETDVAVPSIPDRPLPIVANLDDIEKSVSSSGSGQLSTLAGYQAYSFGNEGEVLIRESESDYGSNRIEGGDGKLSDREIQD